MQGTVAKPNGSQKKQVMYQEQGSWSSTDPYTYIRVQRRSNGNPMVTHNDKVETVSSNWMNQQNFLKRANNTDLIPYLLGDEMSIIPGYYQKRAIHNENRTTGYETLITLKEKKGGGGVISFRE